MKTGFDDRAKNWDNDPKRVERAKVFFNEIINNVKINKSMTALEYGSGTGLLSFLFQPYFKKIILCDSSDGMLEVLRNKIKEQKVNNMFPEKADFIHDNNVITEKVDIIYTLMTLHHIIDINKILLYFYKLINKKGYLCIADLVQEDGSFHSDFTYFKGHNGFDQNELKDLLLKIGFNKVSSRICFNIKKIINDKEKDFPLFLMIAEK